MTGVDARMGKKQKKEQEGKKILLMGLDDAGKTSLYLILSKNANLLAYYSLRPTRGLDIKTIDDGKERYAIWDFGGQAEFRKQYLETMDENLKEVDKIIYVFDIQNIDRYDESIGYLEKIVDALKVRKIKVPFSIFFHKFDKDLEDKENFKMEVLKERLIDKIASILADFYFEIFKTTIFTLFSKVKLV
jgi:small GTP-binding protein